MGVNQKRKERFQGSVENQAGARAHKHVKESVSTMLCSGTELLMEKVNTGPALEKGKQGVAGRDQNAVQMLSYGAYREGKDSVNGMAGNGAETSFRGYVGTVVEERRL